VPLAFVSAMAFGGVLGVLAAPMPFVEIGIALSVTLLGAGVAYGIKPPVAVAMAVVGLFAIFHGHAHGSEMPLDVSGAAYAAGFMAATAFLYAIGIGLGHTVGIASQLYSNSICRLAGGAASVVGLGLLAGLF
jgi:urease accessory protein